MQTLSNAQAEPLGQARWQSLIIHAEPASRLHLPLIAGPKPLIRHRRHSRNASGAMPGPRVQLRHWQAFHARSR